MDRERLRVRGKRFAVHPRVTWFSYFVPFYVSLGLRIRPRGHCGASSVPTRLGSIQVRRFASVSIRMSHSAVQLSAVRVSDRSCGTHHAQEPCGVTQGSWKPSTLNLPNGIDCVH